MMAWVLAVALIALGLGVFTWAFTQDGSRQVVAGGVLLITAGLVVVIFSYFAGKRPCDLPAPVVEAEREVEDTRQGLANVATALEVNTVDQVTLEGPSGNIIAIGNKLSTGNARLSTHHGQRERNLSITEGNNS